MPPRVVIAAGGTAGHVVPALAVADALRARGAEVSFVGGERVESELVPAAGYPFERLRVAGLDRRNPLKAARAAGMASMAVLRARRLLRRARAGVVIGGGGHVAGPGRAAAPGPPAPPPPTPGRSPPAHPPPVRPPLPLC